MHISYNKLWKLLIDKGMNKHYNKFYDEMYENSILN